MAEAVTLVQAAGCSRALFLLLESLHVQGAVVFEPPLVGLCTQCPDQPQATRRSREATHDPGTARDLLVEPVEQGGRLQVRVVLAR